MGYCPAFEPEEIENLTNASLHGELGAHLNRLFIHYPDDCRKASDIMLFFLSCLADSRLVRLLIQRRVIVFWKRKIYFDARKYDMLRKLLITHYRDQCPGLLFKGFRGMNLSGWPEIYIEEQRKHHQAILARRLFEQKRIVLNVHCSKGDRFGRKHASGYLQRKRRMLCDKYAQLQKRVMEKFSVTLLSDVTILPGVGSQGEETVVGNLEVHATGLTFIPNLGVHAPPCIKMDICTVNIENSFFRLGDERMPPLLHFHLRQPIMVGNKLVQDIQFRLVVHFPLGQKRYGQDSDKIEKAKRIAVGEDNERLKDFVDKVSAQWKFLIQPLSWFEEIDKEYEFYGKSAGFALTSFSLILLAGTPFFVVPLRAIEIVYLALPGHGVIDMTVIFQGLGKVVLKIDSIPLKSLSGIKYRLNWGDVKYYVNPKKPDLRTLMEHIASSPSNFMENEFEDVLTSAYYKETGTDPKRALMYDDEKVNHRWKKRSCGSDSEEMVVVKHEKD